MENFTHIHYIILSLTVGYGIVLGLLHTVQRIYLLIIFKPHHQKLIERLLDSLFYSGIMYLILTYNGVI